MKKKGIALVERQYLFPFVLITSLFSCGDLLMPFWTC